MQFFILLIGVMVFVFYQFNSSPLHFNPSAVKEVMASDFDEPGDDDVLRKVLGDFEAAKVAMTREALRRKMDDLYAEAHLQVTQG